VRKAMSLEIAFLPFCPIRFYPGWNGNCEFFRSSGDGQQWG